MNRPAATGTLGDNLPVVPAIPGNLATFSVNVNGGLVSATCTIDYTAAPSAPTDYAQLRPYVEAAIRLAADSPSVTALAEPARSNVRALLGGATVRLIGRGTAAVPYRFHVLAGRGGSGFANTDTLAFSGGAATDARARCHCQLAALSPVGWHGQRGDHGHQSPRRARSEDRAVRARGCRSLQHPLHPVRRRSRQRPTCARSTRPRPGIARRAGRS